MHDFNGDGKLDIVYVNGDNFDYSRVLKPYHGIRILENDGKNNFHERYFFRFTEHPAPRWPTSTRTAISTF